MATPVQEIMKTPPLTPLPHIFLSGSVVKYTVILPFPLEIHRIYMYRADELGIFIPVSLELSCVTLGSSFIFK
jgi:hypothetical protein